MEHRDGTRNRILRSGDRETGGAFRGSPLAFRESGPAFRDAAVVESVGSLRTRPAHPTGMPGSRTARATDAAWTPLPDTPERFSSGIPDFDRLLGGGYPRGAMTLFELDSSVESADRALLMTPTYLNFLYQSRGLLAVLPSRESPHEFRAHLTKWVSRRRFDTRVRVVEYIGEDDELPYVVTLKDSLRSPKTGKTRDKVREAGMKKMVEAEKAVRGVRSKPFIETVSFEIMDMLMGPETATKMFFHGIKRARMVGNLVLGILRPGVGCADAVRGMADVVVGVGHTELGVTVRGIRPAFPMHLAVVDPRAGEPHVAFLPAG